MSTSAASDLSSLPEKRAPSSPSLSHSPDPKRSRSDFVPDHESAWRESTSPHPQQLDATLSVSVSSSDSALDSTAATSTPDATKVQLPSIFSTFEDPFRQEFRRASLPTLHSESPFSRARNPYAHPTTRSSLAQVTSGTAISSYQFPPSPDQLQLDLSSSGGRPRLPVDTHVNFNYSQNSPYSSGAPTLSSSSSATSSFLPTTPNHGLGAYHAAENQEPNSTPGQLSSSASAQAELKYEDGLRHSVSSSSLGAPLTQQQMFAGTTRIAGHADHHRGGRGLGLGSQDELASAAVKSEWGFSSSTQEALLSGMAQPPPSSAPGGSPNMVPTTSPGRSPPQGLMPTSSLVERPPRKRGKLPKHVTDFLKDWLHRHSDHPYPSEDEKKQLCHATGLSMSQVSNWMINARRRILQPAKQAASNPSTTHPYPPTRPGPPSTMSPARRASMPAETLQLYHPMSLQSLHSTSPSLDYLSQRGLGLGGVSRSSPYELAYPTVGPGRGAGGYQQSASTHHYVSSGMPMTAPPNMQSGHPAAAAATMSNTIPYSNQAYATPSASPSASQGLMYAQQTQHHQHQHPGTYGGGGRVPSPQDQQRRYYSDERSPSGNGSSGYGTPQ